MSRRTKPQRYQDILSFPNVSNLHHYQPGEYSSVRGQWADVFGNPNPVTLELACGKGEYTLALGSLFPDRNFIGLDVKGDRIWKGARQALDKGMKNVHFIRTQIDHICNYFSTGEVEEIWIPFPDPYPKKSKKQKRLTHPVFLQRYFDIIQPGGLIHLKTDSDHFFNFTLQVIHILGLPLEQQVPDIYRLENIPDYLDIQTFYEKQHLSVGCTIKYVSFGLNDAVNNAVRRKEIESIT